MARHSRESSFRRLHNGRGGSGRHRPRPESPNSGREDPLDGPGAYPQRTTRRDDTMTESLEREPLVGYLERLRDKDDRGALAALRRALGKPPGEAPEAYPYVVPFLPREVSAWQEQVYYLVAALFAVH